MLFHFTEKEAYICLMNGGLVLKLRYSKYETRRGNSISGTITLSFNN